MDLIQIIGLDELIQTMDIGASCITETPVYNRLLDKGLAHLNAFEGDARQIQKIEEAYKEKVTIFNDFLSDGSEKTLYLANEATGMTSLLKPHLKALKFFNGFESFGEVLKTEKIQTKKLDDIKGLPLIDFLKMDIQGSELNVLKNGKYILKRCLAIQVEVSYICLYENQPSFGEIDLWMRQNGYVPHCFLDIKKWSITPTIKDGNFRIPFNQLLESDIVYVRDPLNLSQLDDVQLKKIALIAHFCFESYDLCGYIMLELISRGVLENNAHQKYLENLNGQVQM